jgi:hypothetical protein
MQYVLTQEEYDEQLELIRLGKLLRRERLNWDDERDKLRFELTDANTKYNEMWNELHARKSRNICIGVFDNDVCDILTKEFRRMRKDTPSGCGRITRVIRRKRANDRGAVYIEVG